VLPSRVRQVNARERRVLPARRVRHPLPLADPCLSGTVRWSCGTGRQRVGLRHVPPALADHSPRGYSEDQRLKTKGPVRPGGCPARATRPFGRFVAV
jgi:hypothetical protein